MRRRLRPIFTLLCLALAIAVAVVWFDAQRYQTEIRYSAQLAGLRLQTAEKELVLIGTTHRGVVDYAGLHVWRYPLQQTYRTLDGLFPTTGRALGVGWIYRPASPGVTSIGATIRYPLLLALLLGWPILHLALRLRRRRRRPGHCPDCGYDLRSSMNGCPECGRGIRPAADTRPTEENPSSASAV